MENLVLGGIGEIMNQDIYESLKRYLELEIKNCKLRINVNYGCFPYPNDEDRSDANELYETMNDLRNIKIFVNYVNRNSFDKRFYELMFGNDLTPYVDMRKLTHAIVEMVAHARKNFPKQDERDRALEILNERLKKSVEFNKKLEKVIDRLKSLNENR